MKLKRVYLARRNPSLSHAAFRAAWEDHHRLGRSFPELRFRYPRAAYHAAVPPSDYDGVGMMWMRDAVSLAPGLRDENAIRIMRSDELRVFAAPVFGAALVAREHILKTGEGTYTLFAFLRRRPEMTRAEFDRELLAYAPGADPEKRCMVLGEPTLACDGIVEIQFKTLDAARFVPPPFASNPIVMVTQTLLDWTATE